MIKFLSGNTDYSTYTISLDLLDKQYKTDYSTLYSIYIIIYKLKELIDEIESKLETKETSNFHNDDKFEKLLEILRTEFTYNKYKDTIQEHLQQFINSLLVNFRQIPNLPEENITRTQFFYKKSKNK